MKKVYIFLLTTTLFLISVTSCTDGKIESGEIEYEVTYPYNTIESKMMQMMLPKKMTVIFKGGKILARIQKGTMFTTEVVSDEATKTLEMRLNFGSDIYNTHLNADDIQSLLKSQPLYNIKGKPKQDSLLSCKINTYTLDCPNDTLPEFESSFSEDFTVNNAIWFSSYKDIKGMPMIYLIDRYGIIMKITAKKLTPRDVDDNEFEPTENYKEISYKKYDKKLSSLFSMIQ